MPQFASLPSTPSCGRECPLPDPRIPRLRAVLAAVLVMGLLIAPIRAHAEDDKAPPAGEKAEKPADLKEAEPSEDDEDLSEEEEERLEAIERHSEKGLEAFRRGSHEEVLARMERLARYDKDNPLVAQLTARVQRRTGKYKDAMATVAAARKVRPDDVKLKALQYRVWRDVGDWSSIEKAATEAAKANPTDVMARVVLSDVHEEFGRRDKALAVLDEVLQAYNNESTSTADIPWVARAAERATWLSDKPDDDMLTQAQGLMQKYIKEHEDDTDAILQYADLFRSDKGMQGQSSAAKHYKRLLKENSEIAIARVGLAYTQLVFYKQSQALKGLARALQTNPNLVPALALKAQIHVGDGDYEDAEALIQRAHAVDPDNKDVNAIEAALHYIRGDQKRYEELRDKVLGRDPKYGQFYLTVSELVGERQRRYDTAGELARKAIEIDPTDRNAYVALGEALMNTGKTDEALKLFNKGYEVAKQWADIRRDNWIEVLTQALPKHKVFKTKHFIVRIPFKEAPVMKHYLLPLLEEAYDVLGKKYGVQPPSVVYADAFDRDDDFSVRSVGTLGLPALGVCFGNVVTLLGPTAKPMGQFSWSRTTWHEFAHVVTLTQSEGQVPRWLTEGLSVFEEGQRKKVWGRDMDVELFNRWHNGSLLKMGSINSAFRGPDIMFAYFQGGLIAEHLQEARGFDVIPKMLKLFAKDKSTKEVFEEILELELDKYDAMFHEYVGKIVSNYKMVPTWNKATMRKLKSRTSKNPKDGEAWARLAWGHFQRKREIDAGAALQKAIQIDAELPEVVLLQARMAQQQERDGVAKELYEKYLDGDRDDLRARLFLAEYEMTHGTDTDSAVAHLQAAKKCFPRYAGKDNPYSQLAKLYRSAGMLKRSIQEMHGYIAVAPKDYKARKELLDWHIEQKEWKQARKLCEEMVDISPFGGNVSKDQEPDLDLHRHYAKALTQLGDTKSALRELRVQVELGDMLPEEKQMEAGVLDDRISLGQVLLDDGDTDGALEQAFAALRIDPENVAARMLKQQATEGRSSGESGSR